jgi:DNA (cytosine-5)-methyltransferase 1
VNTTLNCLEICAGAGGQALGLEQAGFAHLAAVEIDLDACQTLRLNRPQWKIQEQDVRKFDASPYRGQVDLLSGGVPCQPFSVGGKQAGEFDERDLFPEALRLVTECDPAAVMLENVPGLAQARFTGYREQIFRELGAMGYQADWHVLNARDFGVPQLRLRFILVAMRPAAFGRFTWPEPSGNQPTVGEALHGMMAEGGWTGAAAWAGKASGIAPTLVGGSKKHGGADLGPTRARAAWARLGVDGRGLADAPPPSNAPADHRPRLTQAMAAIIQGFPSEWRFHGKKTAAYRQVGNAFPPPAARAVGMRVHAALRAASG